MNRFSMLSAVFVLGLMTATFAPRFIQAAHANPMHMSTTKTMSGAGMQMQRAMDKMNDRTKSMHMTGDTDRDFMLMMMPHHQAAIDMAKVELRWGHKPALKAMARDVIAAQSREIAQMRNWLRQWYAK